MEPIPFKGQNIVFGANQPEYRPLPALKINGPEGEVITCWQMTDEEIEAIVQNKCIYFKQLTFNGPLQPILPMAQLGDDVDLNV